MIPINDRVILQLEKPEEVSRGGIILAPSAQKKSNAAKVVSVGPNCTQVRVGDTVLISEYSGVALKIDDVEHTVVREDDILVIASRSK